MKNFSGVCQAAGADKPLRAFFIWITNIVTLAVRIEWKFRCKVTPCVRSQTALVCLKMTPCLKNEILNRMQASAVFHTNCLHS